jgi:hypothetical protein
VKNAAALMEEVADTGSGVITHVDEVAEAAADGGAAVCFAAGTLVETRDGLRPIETIVPGDLVLSRDPETGQTAWRPVVQTFATPDQALRQLELIADDGVGLETLRVTADHPFWTPSGWTAAKDLTPGTPVLTSSSGWLRVGSGTWEPERETVYDFEVEQFHTYFVGTSGAWVHNSCQAKPPGGGLSAADRQRIQRFADEQGVEVNVVGSRANGTAGPDSDYDYIIGEAGGTSAQRNAARRELPRGTAGGEVHPSRGETGIDVFRDTLDRERPHITFRPKGEE